MLVFYLKKEIISDKEISLTFMSLLCVSDLATTDGHLFLPNWVSVPDQSLFSLPLLQSTGDR